MKMVSYPRSSTLLQENPVVFDTNCGRPGITRSLKI